MPDFFKLGQKAYRKNHGQKDLQYIWKKAPSNEAEALAAAKGFSTEMAASGTGDKNKVSRLEFLNETGLDNVSKGEEIVAALFGNKTELTIDESAEKIKLLDKASHNTTQGGYEFDGKITDDYKDKLNQNVLSGTLNTNTFEISPYGAETNFDQFRNNTSFRSMDLVFAEPSDDAAVKKQKATTWMTQADTDNNGELSSLDLQRGLKINKALADHYISVYGNNGNFLTIEEGATLLVNEAVDNNFSNNERKETESKLSAGTLQITVPTNNGDDGNNGTIQNTSSSTNDNNGNNGALQKNPNNEEKYKKLAKQMAGSITKDAGQDQTVSPNEFILGLKAQGLSNSIALTNVLFNQKKTLTIDEAEALLKKLDIADGAENGEVDTAYLKNLSDNLNTQTDNSADDIINRTKPEPKPTPSNNSPKERPTRKAGSFNID